MRAVHNSLLGIAALSMLLAQGCKRDSSEPAGAAPSAAPSASARLAAPRCSEIAGSFTIGERKSAPEPDGGEEVSLPYAVEVGGAVPYADGFAVAALRSQQGGTGAIVALLGPGTHSGRVVELGRTFGDAEPPRLAARGKLLIAAVPDNDAGGGTLRLAAIQEAKPTWGAEIEQTRDESQVFDVELGAKRGLLVWDEWEKKAEQGLVRVVSFDPADLGSATRPRALSPEGDDAEAPELAPRTGGFWIAWISRQPPERTKPKAKPKQPGKPAPAASDRAVDDPVVDLGRRWLRIAPLDENGALVSEPRDVTGRQTHVLVFDLAPLADGGALLAWRDDASSPGVEGGAVHLARVLPDGALEHFEIEDEKVGAGTPHLIADPSGPAQGPALWLALDSVTDATRLVALGKDGRPLDALDDEPVIGHGEPLVLGAGGLLLAHPRGLAVELTTARCRAGLPPDAGTEK